MRQVVIKIILLLIIIASGAFLGASEPERAVIVDKVRTSIEAYCTTFSEESRQVAIDTIREEFPEWPEKGLCGLLSPSVVSQ